MVWADGETPQTVGLIMALRRNRGGGDVKVQKFIVIGVGEFDAKDDTTFEDEDLFNIDEFEPLDFVANKANEISIALEETGLAPVGSNPILHPSYADLKDALKEARGGRMANSAAVIHYIGHGIADSELGVLHLPARDTDLEELGDTSVDVGALINAIESNQRGPHSGHGHPTLQADYHLACR